MNKLILSSSYYRKLLSYQGADVVYQITFDFALGFSHSVTVR